MWNSNIYVWEKDNCSVDIYILAASYFARIEDEIGRKYRNKIIAQLLPAFVATNRPVDFNPYVRAENRRPTDGRRFIYRRKDSGTGTPLSLSFSRRFFYPKQDSIWPLPTVLPSKRNHHCRRIWLNGPRHARNWSAASSINLISNALSPRSLLRPFFLLPLSPSHHPLHSRPPQLLDEQEFSILSSITRSTVCPGACCSSVLLAGTRKLRSQVS